MSLEVRRHEVIAKEPAEAVAGLLDIGVPDSGEVPELWHWFYLLERPSSRELGRDGHPTSGVPAPPARGMRRMFAGGRVDTRRRLRIGAPATRVTRIVNETEKLGRTGPLTFVTVRHEVTQDDHVVIVDEQDIVYRAPDSGSVSSGNANAPAQAREVQLLLNVDERLLFRFSALTYNAHRIHYDREWCRHEGYDDLVVHGPLQALMMGELARRNGVSLVGRQFAYRLVSPMIGPQQLHALAAVGGLDQGAEVRTADGRQTATSTIRDLSPLR